MAKQIRTFEPEERSYLRNGLYCPHCGNTNQWQIDLRLKHQVECISAGLSVALDALQTKKILKAIENNLITMVDKSLDTEKTVFQCANCENSWIDFHERVIESCAWSGCLGCFHCGNWVSEEDLIEICSDCINERKGDVDEDFCDSGLCPVSDFGLREVMDHYGTTLNKIRASLGWF